MKKTFLFLILLLLPLTVSAQDSGKKKAIYFYSETCVHCARVEEYFQREDIYNKYEIRKIVVPGPENSALLNDFFDVFGIEPKKRGWPVVFFDGKMLVGDLPIIEKFVIEIEKSNANEFPTPESVEEIFEKSGMPLQYRSGADAVSLPVLIGAALVDAINPCAFAVLILLVATVITSGGKRKALFSGLLFTLAIFVSYFLMGLGLYKAIGVFNLPKIFSIIIGVLAILIGLANLKDFFWHGKLFVMEVPMSWRPKMQATIKHVTSPIGALAAGFLVSLFLLPCTSGPYVVILGLLAERENLTRTVSLLFLYNLVFVLPMIAITLAMYFGVRARRLEEFRKRNIRILHGIAGAIMLFIGSYLLYNWL